MSWTFIRESILSNIRWNTEKPQVSRGFSWFFFCKPTMKCYTEPRSGHEMFKKHFLIILRIEILKCSDINYQ
jgi:hypothetical protein